MWVEEPGYRMARDVFALIGCHLVPVPVDNEGLDVAAGIKQAPARRAPRSLRLLINFRWA